MPRPFQFSLARLFAATAVCSIGAALLAVQPNQVESKCLAPSPDPFGAVTACFGFAFGLLAPSKGLRRVVIPLSYAVGGYLFGIISFLLWLELSS